jgi:hypothetical protein
MFKLAEEIVQANIDVFGERTLIIGFFASLIIGVLVTILLHKYKK